MHIDDVSTPVVVLRNVRHGGLGITRSLGRLGVPVYNIDRRPETPAFWSRYSRGRFLWDLDTAPAEESVRFLLETGRKIGRRSILIPTTDSAAMFAAGQAGALREWFLFPDQDAALVRGLCSKKEMYFLARKTGVPTPETVFPQSRADVLAYLATARFPIMLKGIFGRRLKKRAGKPMFIVRSAKELLAAYDALEDLSQANLMLQEYIPGGDDTVWMFNGYFDRHGECLLGFTGKKIRQCPVHTGPTCLGICLRNDIVDRTTRAFMKAVGYQGILDIGYRYDARDGQYKVLDVNPRIGATFRLFVGANGIDVARALYLDLTGQPLPPAPAPEGRKWIVEDCDLVSSIRYHRDGGLGFGEWLKSLGGIREGGFFAWDDPLPLFRMGLTDAAELLRRAGLGRNGAAGGK